MFPKFRPWAPLFVACRDDGSYVGRVTLAWNNERNVVRKIINSTYITLDGVIQNPQDWPALGSLDDAGNAIQTELLEQCDAVLMGRHTYDVFAPVWSARSGDAVSDRMNALPKYVVSSTLTDPQWNNTVVIKNDPIRAVGALKREQGMNIVQYGFGPLSRALMADGLLDELRLWVHPFMLGTGTQADLLYRAGSSGSFTPTDSKTLPNGIIILTFASTTEQSR
jgi:dihydrofolate reductase